MKIVEPPVIMHAFPWSLGWASAPRSRTIEGYQTEELRDARAEELRGEGHDVSTWLARARYELG